MRGLLLSILLLLMNVANAESRYALLLANQNYPTAQKDLNIFGELETPVREMREFAKVLRDYNFEVTEIADANLDDMSVAINRFTRKLQQGDVGLFYYAGHGVQVEGNNYLIPVNKKFADAVEVKNGAYLAQNAIDKLSGSSARVKLVFLDSCRNQLLMKEKGRGFSDPGFAKMDAKGVVISYATGLGEIAADNITYTSQLIKAIRDNQSERIEIVLSEAQELTAQATGGQQIPWYEKGMVGRFCFGTCGKPEPAKQEDNSAELEQLRKENEQLRKAGILPPEVTPPPTKPGQSFRDKLKDGSMGPEMVQIPGGTFQMGSNEGKSDEKPVHTVSVKSFALGKYEVTFEEYDKFCDATGRSRLSDNSWGPGKRPVINVSWDDVKAYTKWLSEQTGKDYRLPSEAQWEYACRAGSTGKYSFGDDVNQLGNYGWYDGNSGIKTHSVGEKQANKFGLYDMHGNVREWLEDVYHNSYSGAPSDGSAWMSGHSNSHLHRLPRGGSGYNDYDNLRCADRNWLVTTGWNYDWGFRISRM
jgi:formylglycine-generating enzyme required for sulfatase activity